MFPSFAELFNEFVAKFKQAKPDVDPTVKGSWPYAFGRGVAAIGFALVTLAKELLKQFNPLTATGPFLRLWASYDGIAQLGASPSIGSINAYGFQGVVVPAGSSWVGQSNGLLYSNTVASAISEQDIDITPVVIVQLTGVGSLVTASCSFPHSLRADSYVTIEGADQADYNGNYQITPDPNDIYTFTYTVPGTPVTPATGTPYTATPIRKIVSFDWEDDIVTAVTDFAHGFEDGQHVYITDTSNPSYEGYVEITIDLTIPDGDKTFTYNVTGDPGSVGEGVVRSVHAIVNVQSQDNGPGTVIDLGGYLDMQGTRPLGLSEEAKAPEGLQGGAVLESDDSLRARMLLARSSQAGVFTNAQIELAVKLINGNTDVYIQNPNTIDPLDTDPVLPGQTRVYFLRRNDPIGPIPTGGTLERTKLSIINNAQLPADVWQDDLFVLPPELTPVDLLLTAVLPDTATMKQAIKSQVEAYFADEAKLGGTLDNDILRAVVKETQDLNSGLPEESFITSFNWTNIRLSYAIYSVTDSGGVAAFHFNPGPVLSVGQEVIIKGMAEASYNGTFILTSVSSGVFAIASVSYVADGTGDFSIETEALSRDELPGLGVLTVNGQVVE